MGSSQPPPRDRLLSLRDLSHDDDPARRARRQDLLSEVHRGLRDTPESTEYIALSPLLIPLFGSPGLARGSTVLITGARGQGATSLALSLCAAPTCAALWVGMLNASRVGLLSAFELGVALDHLVLIPQPIEKVATVASALMEACSLILLGSDRPVTRRDADRLQRRAREHRCVLLVLAPPLERHANRPVTMSRCSLWPEVPDVMIEVMESACVGIGRGAGHLLQRQVRVEITHRRDSVPLRTHEILLPSDVIRPHVDEEFSPHARAAIHQVG